MLRRLSIKRFAIVDAVTPGFGPDVKILTR
jgi:hypothetical protein